MYCIGKPPRLLTEIVGCSDTFTLACGYFLVHLVKSSTISFCDFSRSLGSTNANRTLPEFTEDDKNPGEVITHATFFSGIESLINLDKSSMNRSVYS